MFKRYRCEQWVKTVVSYARVPYVASCRRWCGEQKGNGKSELWRPYVVEQMRCKRCCLGLSNGTQWLCTYGRRTREDVRASTITVGQMNSGDDVRMVSRTPQGQM